MRRTEKGSLRLWVSAALLLVSGFGFTLMGVSARRWDWVLFGACGLLAAALRAREGLSLRR
jgi:hypothetical protein